MDYRGGNRGGFRRLSPNRGRGSPTRLPHGGTPSGSSAPHDVSSSHGGSTGSRGTLPTRLSRGVMSRGSNSRPRGGPSRLPSGLSASVADLASDDNGDSVSHILIPQVKLSESEKATLTTTPHFHGVVRNDTGIFVVFNANRKALSEITPRNGQGPVLHTMSWIPPRRIHLMCSPQHRILDGDLLGILNVSERHLTMRKLQSDTAACWVLREDIALRWASLEGFLDKLAWSLQDHMAGLHSRPESGTMQSRPISYHYTQSFSSEADLFRAVFSAQDAFVRLFSAITLYFLILDASPQRETWRTGVMVSLDLPNHLMDAVETVVERFLRHPAGIILDLTLNDASALDWLFKLLIRNSSPIHPPIYFFLGEGLSAVSHASHLERYPSMEKIRLHVQETIHALNQLTLQSVACEEYVFVQSNMRLWGTFSNPEYYAHLDTQERQFPPVEPHSGQHAGQSYIDFFARRKEANDRREQVETPAQRNRRLQREKNAEKKAAPGKQGARVFKWDQVDNFWVRRSITRVEAEDEWEDFADSQMVYDSHQNEWDLCKALDPHALPQYSDDGWDSDDSLPCMRPYPPPSGPSQAVLSQSGPAQQPPDFSDDYDANLPQDLSAEVRSALNNIDAVLAHFASYHAESSMEDSSWMTPAVDPADKHPARAILEYRVGLVDDREKSFPEALMAKSTVAAYFLGNGTSSTPSWISDAARALLKALDKGKTLADMPPELFDLHNPELVDAMCKECGVIISLLEGISQVAYRSTGYNIVPKSADPLKRELLLFNATTVMHIFRRHFKTWSELIELLHDLGAPFEICVSAPTFGASSYNADLYRFAGLGVRPQGYIPSPQDLLAYWDLARRFLLSPRGRLALQAGGVIAHCLNRNAPSGHQEKRVSWWPQPGTFFTSGLNVGWWTPDCEQWFQSVLKQMRENKAVVLNNGDWKARIRGYSAAGRMAKNLEAVHKEFLVNFH
ncbi:unnamed protein product [Mycena citricolor]|uniref:Uncharacterized protein n=1 Tax=Mycena citricolor TaxID=2018698 RepID=A0AAD2I091_9AGAR|nr:unnamed protein product [Mycena citricolor]